MAFLNPFTGLQGLAVWASQFVNIEKGASNGAVAGDNLKDSALAVLGDTDVITNQGTSNETANLNGNTTSDVVDANGQLAAATVVPGVRAIGPGSSRAVNPISAADVGSDVTVTVASHTQFIGEATGVTYDGGSATGLPYSTLIYIYADDPNNDGGAVTYVGTTDVTDLAKNRHRYYVGSITTPAAAAPPTGGGGGGGGGSGGGILP